MGQNVAVIFGIQLPLTCKPWVTFSNPYNKVRGTYIYKEVFARLLFIASVCILHEHVYVSISILILCIWEYNTIALLQNGQTTTKEYLAYGTKQSDGETLVLDL